nr:response regulator transcription factor [Ramlibacter agri]
MRTIGSVTSSAVPANAPIRVAIVDDDPEFQGALARAVQAADDMALAGRAATRTQGLALLRDTPADVLLVDLGLPDGSGIDVIQAAARAWPDCGIMVSTTFGDETNVMRSIEAGAAGYLLKDAAPGRMVAEIRSLAAGGSPISPIIARQVLRRFRPVAGDAVNAAPPPAEAAPDTPISLSPREREVLDFITKGFTADEIARLMELSRYTVLTFVRRIYVKLKVKSKAEAIYEARTQGLLGD